MLLARTIAPHDVDAFQESNFRAESTDIRLAEIQHRLANSFHVINWMIRSRLKAIDDPVARDQMKWALYMVSSVGLLQERLARSDRTSFASYLREASAIWGRIVADDGIEIAVDADDSLEISDPAATSLALIAHELVGNCAQHAFPDGGPGRISIGMARLGISHGEVTITDNGCGLGTGRTGNREPGCGLSLVQTLADQIGGSFAIGPNDANETKAWVVFPIRP